MIVPLLTIIMPAYNAEKTISQALESLLEQTMKEFEVLIIDGHSTDSTIDIVSSYAAKDTRIRYYSEKDEGIYDAMNKGLELAKGDWVYFLGTDDRLANPTILDQVFKGSDFLNYNVLYGNVKIVGNGNWASDGDIYDGEFDLEKLLNKNICHQAIFYKMSFAKRIGYYNIRYTLCADWDYNLRCWARTEFRYIDTIIANFHAGGISTGTIVDTEFGKNFQRNLVYYFNLSTLFYSLRGSTEMNDFCSRNVKHRLARKWTGFTKILIGLRGKDHNNSK